MIYTFIPVLFVFSFCCIIFRVSFIHLIKINGHGYEIFVKYPSNAKLKQISETRPTRRRDRYSNIIKQKIFDLGSYSNHDVKGVDIQTWKQKKVVRYFSSCFFMFSCLPIKFVEFWLI